MFLNECKDRIGKKTMEMGPKSRPSSTRKEPHVERCKRIVSERFKGGRGGKDHSRSREKKARDPLGDEGKEMSGCNA